MKQYFTAMVLAFMAYMVSAQSMHTYMYVQRDTQNMYMDVYMPQGEPKACVVYAFGGGFMTGSRNGEFETAYLQALQQQGYMAVAFDYRLGLKGKHVNSLSIKPVEQAIYMAVEDLYAVVSYLILHKEEWRLDTSAIVLAGSSAGAITVLQADYMLCRNMPIAQVLPLDFRFAGVISFAGAIFSREGRVNYLREPAPVFFLHGKNDKLVTYKKIQLFNIGFFGTNSLVKRFDKFNYSYQVYRYKDYGHEIAAACMAELLSVTDFIDNIVLKRTFKQTDATINYPGFPRWKNMRPASLGKVKEE